jgi:hypothetical protein
MDILMNAEMIFLTAPDVQIHIWPATQQACRSRMQ